MTLRRIPDTLFPAQSALSADCALLRPIFPNINPYNMTHLLKRTAALMLILMACIQQTAFPQTLQAHIEKAGAYYRLTFTVNSSDVSSFSAPSLAEFDVLSGPATSTISNYQIINGHASHNESTTYTYILSARKSGNITIGQASVHVGGRTVKSRPISLNATQSKGSSGQGAPSSHASGSSQVQQAGSAVTERDLFIDVTPSRTRVHEQEAVLLTYRIHSRVGVGLANTQLVNKPDFKGLISQEIPLPNNQIVTSIEHRANGTYRTGTLLQYVVFPQQSGRITVPSIVFNCTVVQQDNTLDLADAFFNGGGTIGLNVKRVVAPLNIEVKALPQPKPANYSGGVGHFAIKGQLLNPKLRTNDIATYRITLSGVGNMKLISAPQVTFPKDFDTYDPKTSDNSKVTANGFTGEITFDYTFVPRNVGQYEIPSISFTYFDIQSGRYETLHTQAVEMNVEQGERSNADVDRQLQLLHSDIRTPHKVEDWKETSVFSFESVPTAFAAFAILLLAFITVFALMKRHTSLHNDLAGRKRRNAQKNSLHLLDEAGKHIDDADSRTFYTLVAKAVYSFVGDKYGVGTADMNKQYIQTLLTDKGVEEATIKRLLLLMDACEQAQYAPSSADMRQATYNEARQVIQQLAL